MTFKVYGEIEIDGKAARVEIKGVDEALEKAARGADKFSFSGKGAATSANQLKGETTLAAGSVANLGAQFNDIGVMLAAGQNPLQLAIQQGTQITQVFGNAGAASRVAMLKQALASVISPVNLVTIGVIAGGAALAQWGLGMINAGEKTQTFEETLDALEQALVDYRQAAEIAMLGTADLEERFGTASAGLRTSLQVLEDIARSKAQQAIDKTAQSLSDLFEIRGDGDQRAALADFFDVNIGLAFTDAQRAARAEARQLTAEFRNQQIELKQANGDLDAQIAILSRMLSTTEELVEAKDGISTAEEQIIKQIAETLAKMEQQRAKVEEVEAAARGVIHAVLEIGTGIGTAIGPTDDLIGRMSTLADKAWDAAAGFGAYVRQQGQTVAGMNGGPDAARFGVMDEMTPTGLRRDDIVSQFTLPARRTPARTTGTRSGGSASAANAERDAVDDLVRSLQEQLDLVRETDPVQKEMIRNRETLKAATDAEKQSVEQLIASRISEEAAIERASDNAEAFKEIAWEGLDGVLFRSENAADAVSNLADMLAKAAAQSLFLGTGPLAGLFGTKDSGGLLGMLGTALFPGAPKADGGMIYGPGGPRDDVVLTPTSAGEFVVNARATAQNRALLEYINGGGLVGNQGFATGGMPVPVPMPSTQGGGVGSQGRVVISLAPSPLFEARVVEASQGIFSEGMEQYRAQGLPQDVERISLDPGRRG